MSKGDPGFDDNEWVYGVQSRLKVCTGVIAPGPKAESLSVPSYEVVKIVDGVGSNGYIETEVMARVWASSCEALLTDATGWCTCFRSEPRVSRFQRLIEGSAPPETMLSTVNWSQAQDGCNIQSALIVVDGEHIHSRLMSEYFIIKDQSCILMRIFISSLTFS